MKKFFLSLSLLLFNLSFACQDNNSSSDVFPPVQLDNNHQFNFNLVLDDEYETIEISLINCKNQQINHKDLLAYMGYTGKVEDAFLLKSENNTPVLFVIQSFPLPSTAEESIPFSSDWYFVFVYNIDPINNTFSSNNKEGRFFGAGADSALSFEELGKDKPTNISNYPYKNKNNIIKMYYSDFYYDWKNNIKITGTILNKTPLQDHPLYFLNQKKYLIKGDQFTVTDVSAGWLNIKYTTKNNKVIKGWIICQDTNLCSKLE